jgi:hypothetical protein
LEKQEVEKINAIENFQKDKLKHTEPAVKNVLPDKESKIYYLHQHFLIDWCLAPTFAGKTFENYYIVINSIKRIIFMSNISIHHGEVP